MTDARVTEHLHGAGPTGDNDAWERYLHSVSDYLKRQILIYKNWPQRKYNQLGYLDEIVFNDMNT